MEINATLVVQMVLFLFLTTCLSRFLFAPLIKLFDERENRIQGAKVETQRLQESARLALERVEETIRQAQREARQILLNLKAEGVLYQRRVLDEARHDAKVQADKARRDLEMEVTKVQRELEVSVEPLAGLIEQRLVPQKKSLISEESCHA